MVIASFGDGLPRGMKVSYYSMILRRGRQRINRLYDSIRTSSAGLRIFAAAAFAESLIPNIS